ncbi:MAG: methyltransferase domain-containing protein [Novosphingobium sp.]|nr:methyltransferase domain-containing protein [Novosphingobium sp.]
MNVMHRHRIGAAFSAADEYDRHAPVQHIVARGLASRIAVLPLPSRPRILEIGCGTGFLTEAIMAQGMEADWYITDISPQMLQRCRKRVGEAPDRRFCLLDGEYGEPEEMATFDLICSSLAMQWFDDQGAALSRLLGWLRPGGHCIFTTLGSDTFKEWRAAHRLAGLHPGTPDFMTVAQIAAMDPGSAQEPPNILRYVEHHDSALHFMRSLKAIGASTARDRHRPLKPAQIRKVMRNFETGGAAVTYEVATCHHMRSMSDRR